MTKSTDVADAQEIQRLMKVSQPNWVKRVSKMFAYIDAMLMGVLAGIGTLLSQWWLTSISVSAYPYWMGYVVAAWISMHVTVVVLKVHVEMDDDC